MTRSSVDNVPCQAIIFVLSTCKAPFTNACGDYRQIFLLDSRMLWMIAL